MLARIAFLALTTALALLVAGPTPGTSLPVGSGVVPAAPIPAATVPAEDYWNPSTIPTFYRNVHWTTTMIPNAYATDTPYSSEEIVNPPFDDTVPTDYLPRPTPTRSRTFYRDYPWTTTMIPNAHATDTYSSEVIVNPPSDDTDPTDYLPRPTPTSSPTFYRDYPWTTTMIPSTRATGTPSSSEEIVYNLPHRHRPSSKIRSPYRYTYGNGLDQYDDEEDSDDTVTTEYLPRPTPTSHPGTAGKRGGNAQRPFVVDDLNSTPLELRDDNDESTWFGGEEVDSSILLSELEDTSSFQSDLEDMMSEEIWSARFVSPPRPQKSSCEISARRYIGIDLRENKFSVGFVNAKGKAELIPNEEGKFYTPADVRFIDGGHRAIVGSSAWSTSGNTTRDSFVRGTREPRNQVDLSKLRDAHAYKLYPEAVRFGLSDTAPIKVNFDPYENPLEHDVREKSAEGDILTVLMQRAVDMAEAHLEEKIEGVYVTYPKKVLKYGAIGDSFLRDTIFDSRREKAIMQAGSRLPQLKMYDYYPEILALMVGHVSFFESRLQRKPDVSEGYWNSKHLSQIVLLYSLRDSSEDLVVMRYTKGAYGRHSFHLDFVSGYLPNDDNIQDQFSRYMFEYILDRFNRGIGVRGTNRSRKEGVDPEYRSHYDTLVKSMDEYSATSFARDDWKSLFQITKDSYVIVTIKDYRECKMQFLKERLTATVEQVLADAGVEDWSQIDHLVVADASRFQAQSTVVLEDIVFGGKGGKAVTEVDPQMAIAEGIAMIAGRTD